MNRNHLKDYFFRDNPVKTVVDDPDKLISQILPNAYIIAAFILFLYLIFGGFMMVTSGGDTKQTEQGQQAITNAIIGFVLIFVSYWIIQIIEIITGIQIV